MKKLFVFAIGGTGSRVLRSFMMLLAGNAPMGNFDKVVPIVLDLDVKNGDTLRTLDVLDAYSRVKKDGNVPDKAKSFFAMPLDKVNNSFQFDFLTGGQATTFANYINEGILDDIDKELLHSLYEDSNNSDAELYLDLTVGFKGNPNIGSVVFNDIKQKTEFKDFVNTFVAGDEIFIISSIFGGTGASGFPQLVNLIRNSTNRNVAESPIGTLIMMPYFDVATNPNGMQVISSDVFNSKTKAALSYYEGFINSKLSTGYYMNDNQLTPISYSEGGMEQKNETHVAELIAASSIVDYAQNDRGRNKSEFYEFGVTQNNATTLTLNDFLTDAKQTVAEPLLRLRYFQWLYEKHKNLADRKASFRDSLVGFDRIDNDLKRFLNYFQEWITELENAGRTLKAFNGMEDNLDNMVKGSTTQTSVFGIKSLKLKETFFTDKLNIVTKETNKTILEDYYTVAEEGVNYFNENKKTT